MREYVCPETPPEKNKSNQNSPEHMCQGFLAFTTSNARARAAGFKSNLTGIQLCLSPVAGKQIDARQTTRGTRDGHTHAHTQSSVNA